MIGGQGGMGGGLGGGMMGGGGSPLSGIMGGSGGQGLFAFDRGGPARRGLAGYAEGGPGEATGEDEGVQDLGRPSQAEVLRADDSTDSLRSYLNNPDYSPALVNAEIARRTARARASDPSNEMIPTEGGLAAPMVDKAGKPELGMGRFAPQRGYPVGDTLHGLGAGRGGTQRPPPSPCDDVRPGRAGALDAEGESGDGMPA